MTFPKLLVKNKSGSFWDPGFFTQKNPGFFTQKNPGFFTQKNPGFFTQKNPGFFTQKIGFFISWVWPPSQDAGSSTPGFFIIFRIGDPELSNLHLPLESWEWGQHKLYYISYK